MADTVGADVVGAYGGDPAVTPNMDRIAREGIRFNARSVASWTAPTLRAMLTSLYPSEHGYGSRWKLTSEIHPLPELLRKAGYDTAAFVDFDMPVMAEGFTTYECVGCSEPALERRKTENTAAVPFDRARQWIQSRGTGRFFVLIHTYEAHDYYFAKSYQRAAADRALPGYRGPARTWRPSSSPEAIERIFTDQLANLETSEYLSALYRAGVAAIDAEIGRFDLALQQASLADDTVLIVIGDHGEGFDPARHRLHHGGRLHEDLLRVPLVIRWPNRIAPAAPNALASVLDVMPTIQRIAGVPPAPHLRGVPLVSDGLHEAPAVHRSAAFVPAELPQRELLAEESVYFVRPDGRRETSDLHQFALYSRGSKVIHSPAATELYDLDADPGERTNLAAKHPRIVRAMRERIGRIVHDLGPARGVSEPAVLEVLRSLGYVR